DRAAGGVRDHRGRGPPGRAEGRRQVLRAAARAQGHRPRGPAWRGRRRHRAVRIGQVDAVPRDQPARDDRRRLDHPRRQAAPAGGQGTGRAACRGRHGLPELQPLRPQDDPRQRDAGPDQGARHEEGGGGEAGPRAPRARRCGPPGREVPRPALRRPAAARGHRPRPGHGAQGDALRRADVRARSGDDQGGPRRDGRAGPGRHDDGRGDPRDGLRAHRGRPGGLHGRRRDRGGEHPRGVLHQPALRARPGLPRQDPQAL
ncbi:MAG: ABC transporter, ATP-binding protein (cluster 3, basic aa/glutamine/opines), partial [uncultured Nocardioides sp.]